MRKPTIWFPTKYDTNRPVQSKKQEDEGLYYLCSKNKGTDQRRPSPTQTNLNSQRSRLEVWIQEDEGLYYLSGENKGTGQRRPSPTQTKLTNLYWTTVKEAG